jgi:hypothetical protein
MFRGVHKANIISIALMMEAVSTSEASVNFYETTYGGVFTASTILVDGSINVLNVEYVCIGVYIASVIGMDRLVYGGNIIHFNSMPI